jgi:hypothetical protein
MTVNHPHIEKKVLVMAKGKTCCSLLFYNLIRRIETYGDKSMNVLLFRNNFFTYWGDFKLKIWA